MNLLETKFALKVCVEFRARTGLAIGSGRPGQFADTTLDLTSTDADHRHLHINGFVWASLLRRAMRRVNGREQLAATIGKYQPAADHSGPHGVSPIWTEASFVPLPQAMVRYGNRMSRAWKAVETGAVYSQEIAPAGLTIHTGFNIFCYTHGQGEEWQEAILDAMWIIHQGVETIGGDWSYGLGRLSVMQVSFKLLDLKLSDHRALLWREADVDWDARLSDADIDHREKPAISRPWITIRLNSGLWDGQLMAIRDTAPPPDIGDYPILPDTFVYRQAFINADGELLFPPTITGKAVRQAVFATGIERRLRSTSGRWPKQCQRAPEPPELKTGQKDTCACRYCLWFGNTSRRGMLSVADATVTDPEFQVLFRSQLCEHSGQNVQLFNGEFLAAGTFPLEIMIDCDVACDDEPMKVAKELVSHVRQLLAEMHPDTPAPNGWHRIGGTATATGQLAVLDTIPTIDKIMEQLS